MPIPKGLLEWHERLSCFMSPEDSAGVYAQVDNLGLLIQILVSGKADWQSFAAAAQRGLELVGPTEFFRRLTEANDVRRLRKQDEKLDALLEDYVTSQRRQACFSHLAQRSEVSTASGTPSFRAGPDTMSMRPFARSRSAASSRAWSGPSGAVASRMICWAWSIVKRGGCASARRAVMSQRNHFLIAMSEKVSATNRESPSTTTATASPGVSTVSTALGADGRLTSILQSPSFSSAT